MKNKLLLLSVFIFLGTLISYASCPGDTAHFTSNAPKCVSDSVHFTNTSVIAGGDGIASVIWTFGDPSTGVHNTSTLANPSHLFSVGNQTFFVKLVVTYNLGCKDSVTIGVGIQSLVITNAGSNITSCKNNTSVNLVGTVTNAGGGFWTGTGGFSNISSLTPIYTPTVSAKASGKDTVILTSFSSPYCPNVSDTMIIFFNNGPVVNAGADISVCKDTSGVPITATVTGATGGIWETTGGGTFADSTHLSTIYFPNAADTAAGSVVLYMKSTGNGICSSSHDSLTVTFTATPTVLIKTSDSSCSGSPIILTVAVSTGAGVWSSNGTGTFLPSHTALNGFYYPSAADKLAGLVTLKFVSTNNGGCHSAFDTLNVTIKPSPTAAFTYVSNCAGSPVIFTDSSYASGTTITSWNWAFGDLSLPSTQQNTSHAYLNCGSHTVTLVVQASNGCIDTKLKTINVYCIPTANYTATGVCLNNGTAFTNTSTISTGTIATTNWTFGDQTSSAASDPTHLFPSSGSFPVTLIVNTTEGCKDTLVQTLSIFQGPTAQYTADDFTARINQTVSFQDQSSSTISWQWNFGDQSGSSTQSPSHAFTVGGYYNVCLVASDASNCTDTICKQEIVAATPAGPKGFTPNGDGQNDKFFIYGGPFHTFELKIYDGWGVLVYESNNQSDGWDGKYKGTDEPMGVYVYTVVGVTEDNIEYKVSGDITLLR
jgi:gliding motility-associated-like protein